MDQADEVKQVPIESNDLGCPVTIVRVARPVGKGVRVESAKRSEDMLDRCTSLIDGLERDRVSE